MSLFKHSCMIFFTHQSASLQHVATYQNCKVTNVFQQDICFLFTLLWFALKYFFFPVKGTHGHDCAFTCDCKNLATCDHVTGHCNCLAGWSGTRCDKPCNEGFYGQYCIHECQCQNGATCDSVDGTCLCPPGYEGEYCERTCTGA